MNLLTEIDYGPDENRLEPEVIARIGTESIVAWDQEALPARDWIAEPFERVANWKNFFRAQGRRNGQEALLLVTSSGAARFALRAHDELIDASDQMPSLKIRTGACARIDIEARQPTILRAKTSITRAT